jgi:prostaglandin-H2 D-isomerase / glutathione transferase
MLEIALCHYETDEAIKEKKFKELKADIAPMYLDKLDEIAKANNGYLANGKVKLKQN